MIASFTVGLQVSGLIFHAFSSFPYRSLEFSLLLSNNKMHEGYLVAFQQARQTLNIRAKFSGLEAV